MSKDKPSLEDLQQQVKELETMLAFYKYENTGLEDKLKSKISENVILKMELAGKDLKA
jgi:regulator of replication initiation timing